MALALSRTDAGIIIPIVAKPSAKKDDVVGVYGTSLKLAVTAAPEKGKANKAILKLLAKRLGVSPSSVSILSGETSKQKKVLVQGVEADEIQNRLRLAGNV